MKHKKLFIALTAVFSAVLFLAIFITVWFAGDRYPDFKDFKSEFKIPGLNDGATPQGIANVSNVSYTVTTEVTDENGETTTKSEKKTQEYFFISAYFDKQPSRVYVIGRDTGLEGYVTMKMTDGENDYTGHCGGIAVNRDYMWIASDDTVFVTYKSTGYASIAEELADKAKAGKEDSTNGVMTFTTSFAANGGASFLYYYDYDAGATAVPSSNDKLYVGEFYRSGNYETDKSHKITTPNGDKSNAFVYEYSVNNSEVASNKTGLTCVTLPDGYASEDDRPVPKIQKIISVPDEIQGFARVPNPTDRSKEALVLSRSWALKNSTLYYYDWASVDSTTNRRKFNSEDIAGESNAFAYAGVYRQFGSVGKVPYTDSSLYVYFADSAALAKTYSIPSMAEGLCVSGERVCVLFESGSVKYKTFVREILNNVYSFVPRKADNN